MRPLPLLCLALVALASPLTAQDRLVLKNGSEVEGRIVADTGESVVLSVKTAGSKGTMTFPYTSLALLNDVDADEIVRIRTLAGAVEERLQDRRGARLTQSIRKDIVTSGRFGDRLTKELDRLIPPARLEGVRKTLSRLGLYPRNTDLRRARSEQSLFERQAFTEDARRTLVLLAENVDLDDPEAAAVDQFWAPLGRRASEMAVSLETARAILKENYGWTNMEADSELSTDEKLARETLLSGNAFWTTLDDWAGVEEVDLSGLGAVRPILVNAPLRGQAALSQRAPAFIAVWRFPMLEGSALVQALRNIGGWKLVDRAHEDPPASTEQILHPESYLLKRDPPTRISLGDFRDELGSKAVSLDSDTLGEWRLREMLRPRVDPETLEAAATGWDGDRYASYEKANGGIAVIWFTTWDSAKDAAEFASVCRAWLQGIHRIFAERGTQGGPAIWDTEDDLAVVETREQDVVVGIGIPESALSSVWTRAWMATKQAGSGSATLTIPAELWTKAQEELATRTRNRETLGMPVAQGRLAAEGNVFEDPEAGFRLRIPEGMAVTETPGIFGNGATGTRLEVRTARLDNDYPVGLIAWEHLWGRPESESVQMRRPTSAMLLGGTPAVMTGMTVSREGKMIEVRDVLCRRGGRLYHLVIEAPAATFGTLEPGLIEAVRSFQFTS